MERSLGHAIALRTVGRVFDAEAARDVIIEERTESVELQWSASDGRGKTARYPWLELDRLARVEQLGRIKPSLLRADQQHKDANIWSDLLRTLGQDLDEEAAETSSITGDLNWFTASWVTNGRYVTRQYTALDLREANRRRAALRSASA
jgi:hypothetical protein